MSNFQIHELTEKAINRNSNIIHDTLNSGSYGTGKNIVGAVADLASANVAAPYDTTVTYAIGQYCLYEGDIYRCIAITTGAFDSTKWTQIVVTGEFRRVVELTSAQYTALSSAEKNNGTLYIITDEETTADDIPYSAGVSVADKLDSLSYTEGSSGNYKYRKWNDGTLEVWGKYVNTESITFGASGVLYAYTMPALGSYPVAFTSIDYLNYGGSIKGMTTWASLYISSSGLSLGSAPNIILFRTAAYSDTNEVYEYLYVKGKWN